MLPLPESVAFFSCQKRKTALKKNIKESFLLPTMKAWRNCFGGQTASRKITTPRFTAPATPKTARAQEMKTASAAYKSTLRSAKAHNSPPSAFSLSPFFLLCHKQEERERSQAWPSFHFRERRLITDRTGCEHPLRKRISNPLICTFWSLSTLLCSLIKPQSAEIARRGRTRRKKEREQRLWLKIPCGLNARQGGHRWGRISPQVQAGLLHILPPPRGSIAGLRAGCRGTCTMSWG